MKPFICSPQSKRKGRKRKARSSVSEKQQGKSSSSDNSVTFPPVKRKKLSMSTSNVRVPPEGSKWPAEVEGTFIELMYSEVVNGNIYTTTFTPSVWKDIMNKLAMQCGVAYDVKRLKAKHSRIKELWRKFHDLMVAETGLGWDDQSNMPVATPQLWQDIIQRNPRFAEIRHKGCPHYSKLCTIFAGRSATGYAARASTQGPFTEPVNTSGSAPFSTPNDADVGEAGPSPMPTYTARRTWTQQRGPDDRDVLNQVMETLAQTSNKSQAAHDDLVNYGPERVVDILREYPQLTRHQWSAALQFLENSTRRRFFISMSPDERLEYLTIRLGW